MMMSTATAPFYKNFFLLAMILLVVVTDAEQTAGLVVVSEPEKAVALVVVSEPEKAVELRPGTPKLEPSLLVADAAFVETETECIINPTKPTINPGKPLPERRKNLPDRYFEGAFDDPNANCYCRNVGCSCRPDGKNYDVICPDDVPCRYDRISNTDAVTCSGSGVSISPSQPSCHDYLCRGLDVCFLSISSLQPTCHDVLFQNVNSVTCDGEEICVDAEFDNVTHVKCNTDGACMNAEFNNVGLVHCNSSNACKGFADPKDPTWTWEFGDAYHAYSEYDFNGILLCDAPNACGEHIEIESDTSCLICNEDGACDSSIIFGSSLKDVDLTKRGAYGDCSANTIAEICSIDPSIDIDFLDGDGNFNPHGGDGQHDCGVDK